MFNFAYLFWEHILEDLVGLIVFTLIFLLLPSAYKTVQNCLLLIFIPGGISVAFPDLAYAISYLLRFGTLDAILQPHKPVGTYELFHSPASLIAVPLMIGLVYLMAYALSRMGREVELPKGWIAVVGGISFLGVIIHLSFDIIGL